MSFDLNLSGKFTDLRIENKIDSVPETLDSGNFNRRRRFGYILVKK